MDNRFDIQAQGRAWESGEALDRRSLAPRKIELIEGKLFWTEEERLIMIGLLLENVGVDAVLRLTGKEIWQEAISRREGVTN